MRRYETFVWRLIKMEQWKTIADNPNYEVSNLGNVRRIKTGKLLSQQNSNGYRTVTLWENGKEKIKYVHRLVALAFLDKPTNKNEVNHKDGNRANNCLDNLEWVTPSENILHGYKTLERKPIGAQKKYEKKSNMRLNLKLFRIKKNLTQSEFANKIGISRVAYSLIERGDRGGSFDFWVKLQNAFAVPDEEMFTLMKNE